MRGGCESCVHNNHVHTDSVKTCPGDNGWGRYSFWGHGRYVKAKAISGKDNLRVNDRCQSSEFWGGFDNFPPAPEDVRIAEIANKQKVRIKIVGCGAVPLVVSVSLLRTIPYVILRKERSHGTKKLTVGKRTSCRK